MEKNQIIQQVLESYRQQINEKMGRFFTPYLLESGFFGEVTELNLRMQGYSIDQDTRPDKLIYRLRKFGTVVSPLLVIEIQVIHLCDN